MTGMTGTMLRGALLTLTAGVAAGISASTAMGQGCEPIRFTVPVNLGAVGQVYQPSGWQLTLAYRRLYSNEWFIGSEESGNLAPGGSPPVFKIHTAIADVGYAFNDRLRAHVSVPFSTGSFSRKWADNAFHEQTASGIGDITVGASAWVLTPLAHPSGNVSIGLGVKAPTGSHTKPSRFYLGSGPVDFPADQTIQPGDGGWAVSLELQAFREIVDRATWYASGSYMASPKARSDVTGAPVPAPNSTLYWSVPDVYSARTGIALDVLPDQGVSLSLGGRVDGIPVHDLFGGGDENTIKRTSYILYADPGVSYTHDKTSFTLGVPWRLKLERLKSLAERQPGALPNAGGFAKYLIFVSVTRRF
jgi:hypothetical protein